MRTALGFTVCSRDERITRVPEDVHTMLLTLVEKALTRARIHLEDANDDVQKLKDAVHEVNVAVCSACAPCRVNGAVGASLARAGRRRAMSRRPAGAPRALWSSSPTNLRRRQSVVQ